MPEPALVIGEPECTPKIPAHLFPRFSVRPVGVFRFECKCLPGTFAPLLGVAAPDGTLPDHCEFCNKTLLSFVRHSRPCIRGNCTHRFIERKPVCRTVLKLDSETSCCISLPTFVHGIKSGGR